MANRYWLVGYSYGYVGTDTEYKIDACKVLGYSEEDMKEASNDEIKNELADYIWEEAIQRIDSWVKEID